VVVRNVSSHHPVLSLRVRFSESAAITSLATATSPATISATPISRRTSGRWLRSNSLL